MTNCTYWQFAGFKNKNTYKYLGVVELFQVAPPGGRAVKLAI
jgi:hypothetical protein